MVFGVGSPPGHRRPPLPLYLHSAAERPAGRHSHGRQCEQELSGGYGPALGYQVDFPESPTALPHSAKVMIGTWLRSSYRGRVMDRPLPPANARYGPSSRSIVAALMLATRSTSPGLRSHSSPQVRSLPRSSGRNGASRLLHT